MIRKPMIMDPSAGDIINGKNALKSTGADLAEVKLL